MFCVIWWSNNNIYSSCMIAPLKQAAVKSANFTRSYVTRLHFSVSFTVRRWQYRGVISHRNSSSKTISTIFILDQYRLKNKYHNKFGLTLCHHNCSIMSSVPQRVKHGLYEKRRCLMGTPAAFRVIYSTSGTFSHRVCFI